MSQGLTGPGLRAWSLTAAAHKLDSTLDCARGHPKAIVFEKTTSCTEPDGFTVQMGVTCTDLG